MNGWDAFTWFCSIGLTGSAIVVFAFFLRDIGDVLRGSRPDDDDGGDDDDDDD
jgi:hypothetical protein